MTAWFAMLEKLVMVLVHVQEVMHLFAQMLEHVMTQQDMYGLVVFAVSLKGALDRQRLQKSVMTALIMIVMG